MNFIEMVKQLQDRYKISFSKDKVDFTILDIEILENNPVSWNSHTLYIGNLPDTKNIPTLPVMILSAQDISQYGFPIGSCHAMINSEDIYSIYQAAKDILYQELKSDAVFFKIAKSALNDRNISILINNAASLIGNTLILVDSNMKVLAHSTVFKIMDKLWADNIERGYCPYEFIQKVKSNKDMIGWSKNGEESRIITLDGDIQPKLVTRITQKGHVIGSIVMIVHHSPINPTLSKQLPQIGKILFETFYSVCEDTVNRSFYSTLLYQLLTGDEPSETFDLLTISKSDLPKTMTVVVARFVKRIENRYLKRIIGVELEKIFPDGYMVLYKNYIGILVPEISISQREGLVKLALSENINIGISWTFSDIGEFKKYFYQAVSSIKHAQNFGETNAVLDYTNYSFYDMLFRYVDRKSLQNFCHPALKSLREYDKSNNTELYNTLKTFLFTNKNSSATADALFLHRNSITYRINKIIEIINLDLNDINILNSLIDSFRIEAFLEL